MTDGEIRELCNRFFDAYQDRRIDLLAEIYAPDCIIWHNVFGRDTTGAENLATLRDGYALLRRRSYDDRTIDTFESGFVVRYSVNVVAHDGRRTSLFACVVAQCKDGRITRIDEYMDSSKFAAWVGRGRGAGRET